jgi:hypothetical protein
MKGKLSSRMRTDRSFCTCLFLMGSDQARYQGAINELNNDFVQGTDNYQRMCRSMMTMLSNRKRAAVEPQYGKKGGMIPSTRPLRHETLFQCKKKGHLARGVRKKR